MKYTSLILTTAITLGLIWACGNGSASSDSSSTSTTEPAKTESTTPAATPATDAAAAPSAADLEAGKKTFEQYCKLCHGSDGKLGLNGAKDLTVSVVPLADRIAQVTNGKNLMTPFKDILTESEIKAVAEYSMTLKK